MSSERRDTVVQIPASEGRGTSPDDEHEQYREEFRTKLKSVSASQVKALAFSSLDSFMAEADRYPRFVWQDFLLSFIAFQANSIGENSVGNGPKRDPDGKTNGTESVANDSRRHAHADGESSGLKSDGDTRRYGLQKLSHIIDTYPDILQRELLRDSFHLVQIETQRQGIKIQNQWNEVLKARRPHLRSETTEPNTEEHLSIATEKKVRERYGVLHAAVLLGRIDLVMLVSGPETFREKICAILTTTRGIKVLSSFDLIRRAVLWRHMHDINSSYTKVASLMEDFKSVLTAPTNEAIGTLIDKAARQIDVNHKSDPDPWVILLVWAKAWRLANPTCHCILAEFSKRQVNLFKDIVNSLRRDPCPLKNFLLEMFKKTEQNQNSAVEKTTQSHDSPVEKIEESVEKNSAVEETEQSVEQDSVDEKTDQNVEKLLELLIEEPGPQSRDQFNIMKGFFLDRLSERTPTSLWSPLHLAAARGDDEMVRILIKSCDVVFKALGDQVDAKLYTTRLQESFYDSKDMTPLHYAVLGNHKRIVEALIGWKLFQGYVNEKDIFKRTALQMACSLQDRASIVKHLVKSKKIDVNAKDCCSFSVLHWAVYTESTDAVKFLVFEGGNTNVLRATEKDDEGRHPYELAARLRRPSRKDIHQLLLSSPPVKEEVERLYRDRQVYVDAANAILVGAALIASVTFGGWLQPPLGDHGGSTDGMVRIFWAFSSLSFFFAIATVMAGATAVLPGRDEYIKDAVDSIRRWLAITALLLILSVSCVLGAFAGGGYASASLVPDLSGNMTITTSVGGVVCGTIGVFFCIKLFKIRPDWNHLFKEKRESFSEKKEWWKVFLLPIVLQVPPPIRKRWTFSFISDTDAGSEGSIANSQGPSLPASYGPENSKTWDTVLESLPMISDSSTIPDFFIKMHPEDGSYKRCLIRRCHSQLESFCLREALNCNGIQKEPSLRGYIVMWRDLSSAPLFTPISLTEKMRNLVKQIVFTHGGSSRRLDVVL